MDWKSRELGSREDLVAEIEKQFEMPSDVVREALGELQELRDAWT